MVCKKKFHTSLGVTNSEREQKLNHMTLKPKEGCNRGHGLSAAIKLGSLEKTVGASLIALWCVLSNPFSVEKTKLHNLLPS